MDLRTVVLNSLSADRALTFEEVVQIVAHSLEPAIRDTLNDLADKKQILRHVGGRDHPWRYQAIAVKRRKLQDA